MQEDIEPKKFGLPSSTVLEQIDNKTIAIVIQRKSRIIMDDGRKILEKAAKIKNVQQDITVVLKTTAPVCSKTITFLEGEGIQVFSTGQ